MSGKLTKKDIENDSTLKKFLKKKTGISSSTIEGYIYAIRDFCNFTNKNPTELYNIHKKDLIERTPEFDMWLNEAFDDYVTYLVNSKKNYSYGTINLQISKIKSFYHIFKLKPTPIPDISKKKIQEDFKHALTVEDIRKAIKNSSPTYQAFFITQAQTGLSLSDALLLDVKDFIDAVSGKNEDLTLKEAIYKVKSDSNLIGCFDLRRKKTDIEFYTFAGPEVLHSIASLLESRDEKYLEPESPIFMKNISRLPKEDGNKHLQDLRLKPRVVENYIDRMHRYRKIFNRIEVNGKERNYFRSHKLRKWFANQLRNEANINTDDVKYLMGQKTGDVAERYFNPNNYANLKNNYRKALPHLSINEEVVMEENLEAIEKLQKENKQLKDLYENDSKAKDEEIKNLKAEKDEEMARMDKRIKYMEQLYLDKEFAKDRIK
ncbi:phage integrase N-terminal SAM-like domain-containing protein [Methanobacterium spitsbergense]|uniref:Site-specific integrase n=1 Tax=Methanobacterium spitsbergense TaxID=2874285 RepID=A0A8T5UXM0_9EURY|nr:phage integrase N-terminal SAM-like domain-containing protein [Methanobacterium spitsbergense]MBZ2166656.1 site-specific integrase [Methanobacterium spitsbergense]